VAKLDLTDTEVALLIATVENATYSGKAASAVAAILAKLAECVPPDKE